MNHSVSILLWRLFYVPVLSDSSGQSNSSSTTFNTSLNTSCNGTCSNIIYYYGSYLQDRQLWCASIQDFYITLTIKFTVHLMNQYIKFSSTIIIENAKIFLKFWASVQIWFRTQFYFPNMTMTSPSTNMLKKTHFICIWYTVKC